MTVTVTPPQFAPSCLKDYFDCALKINWQNVLESFRLSFGNHSVTEIVEELLRFLYLLSEELCKTTVLPSEILFSAWNCLLQNPTLNFKIWEELNKLRGRAETESESSVQLEGLTISTLAPPKEHSSRTMYRETLSKYKETFQQAPPSNIWPENDWIVKKTDKTDRGMQSPSSVTHDTETSAAQEPERHSHCCSDIIQVHLNLPPEGSQHTLIVDTSTDTVNTLKQRISALMKTHPCDLVVYHGCTPLTDTPHKTLSHYRLTNNSTLGVFFSLNNMRTFMNKNYFTKVVKLHSTEITSEKLYPTISGISDAIHRKPVKLIDPFQPFTLNAIRKWSRHAAAHHRDV